MEPQDTVFLTWERHFTELWYRLIAPPLGALIVAGVGIIFSQLIVERYLLLIGHWAVIPTIGQTFSLGERFLWGSFLALLVFHYLIIHHSVAFVFPGLYPHERAMVRVPLFWTWVVPIGALASVPIYFAINAWLGVLESSERSDIRAWLIRIYLAGTLSTFLFSLPRRKRSLSLAVFVPLVILLLALPSHVFDTLLTIFIAFCVMLLIGATLLFLFLRKLDDPRYFENDSSETA